MKTTLKKLMRIAAVLLMVTTLLFSCRKDDGNGSEDGPHLKTLSSVSVGNQFNASGMYVNMSTGKVYSQQEAYQKQGEIDFAWFFFTPASATMQALSSPDQIAEYYNGNNGEVGADFFYNANYGFNKWQTINHSELDYTTVTPGEFNNISNGAELLQVYEENMGASTGVELDMEVNKVYAFKTRIGKQGLLLVKSITGSKTTSGSLVMDIKIIE